jgi:hypothetical protein
MNKRKLLKKIITAVLTLVLVTVVVGSASALIVIPILGPFDDVSIFHWAVKDIAWLKNNGITTGYSDNTFRPDNNVTRAEMAAFLHREAGALVAAGAHIVPKSGGGFEIEEWFNNVNGTAPTHTWIFAHGISFDFDMADKLVMCSVDSSTSVTAFCSVDKGTTNVLVTTYDIDGSIPVLEPVGFWVLVYGKDIQP